MKRTYILIASLVLVIVGIGYLYFMQARWSLKHFDSDHVDFAYSKVYRERPKVPAADKGSQLLNLEISKPFSKIELNKEEGAIIAANITKQPLLDVLENNASKKLPLTYPNFYKISSERVKISNQEIGLIQFTYTIQDSKITFYAGLFMIPAGNDAFFLTIQSVDKKQWEADLKTLQKSLKLTL